MNIKQIADKIIKETDIQPNSYNLEDRIIDINNSYLYFIEKAGLLGGDNSVSDGVKSEEYFSITEGGDHFLTRTIKNKNIVKILFTHKNSDYKNSDFEEIDFKANDKVIEVNTLSSGTVKVKYSNLNPNEFTIADYENTTPPEPTMLDKVFHPLLYLKPAIDKSGLYKKERYRALLNQYQILMEMFDVKYRNADIDEVLTFEE